MAFGDWAQLRAFALSLGLPRVEDALAWGNPCLEAHGKMWTWWSPSADVPVFKMSLEEREFLCSADPDTFFFTPHYRAHPLVLVRPDRLDEEWARARLVATWRQMAPKRFLREYDAGRSSV